MPVRFGDYMAGLVRLDLGRSAVQNVPVSDIIAARLPYTIQLAAAALVIALGPGVPLGVFMAVRRKHPCRARAWGRSCRARACPPSGAASC